MKKVWLLAILLSVGPGLGFTETTQERVNDGRNTKNVTTQSMGHDRKSYSTLNQINKTKWGVAYVPAPSQ